jgi:hypothetical protein
MWLHRSRLLVICLEYSVTHHHSQYLRPEQLSASLARDVGNLRTGSRLIVTSLSRTGLTNKQLAGIMEPVPHLFYIHRDYYRCEEKNATFLERRVYQIFTGSPKARLSSIQKTCYITSTKASLPALQRWVKSTKACSTKSTQTRVLPSLKGVFVKVYKDVI